MLSIEGSEFSRVNTSPRIPCSEFKVRRGRRIRITLMAETLRDLAERENHPKITTEKSSYFKQHNNDKVAQRAEETYNVPWVSQVRMSLVEEPHCDDLEHHFKAEND